MADDKQVVRVIAGLGNPGSEYDHTRHNVGFQLVDRLAERFGVSFKRDRKMKCEIGACEIEGIKLYLVKPQTYMNESGLAVSAITRFYKLDVKSVLIVTDDVETGLAKLKIRNRGGNGGHNGLKSVSERLGTSDYSRLRIGVGKDERYDLSDYVLGRFSADEQLELEGALKIAEQVAVEWAHYGFGAAQTLLTRQLSVKNNRPKQEAKDNNLESMNGNQAK